LNDKKAPDTGKFLGILSSAAFGGLQGVNFLGVLNRGFFNVGSHIAVAQLPFLFGIRNGNTKNACGKLLGPVATVALFNDGEAAAPAVGATLGAHEITGSSGFQSGTIHGYHPLSFLIKLINL
jgi:hypothetical protein